MILEAHGADDVVTWLQHSVGLTHTAEEAEHISVMDSETKSAIWGSLGGAYRYESHMFRFLHDLIGKTFEMRWHITLAL